MSKRPHYDITTRLQRSELPRAPCNTGLLYFTLLYFTLLDLLTLTKAQAAAQVKHLIALTKKCLGTLTKKKRWARQPGEWQARIRMLTYADVC
jgi:hypothetical protein